MPRPQKEGLDYFPHDVDSSSDPKVEALEMLYGFEGYAFFFKILECLYRTPNCEIDISDAETKEETLQILAKKTAGNRQKFDKMLDTALRHGCFDKEAFVNGTLTSNGAKKRAKVVIEKRVVQRNLYKERNSSIINKTKDKEKNSSSKVKDWTSIGQVSNTETTQKPKTKAKVETLDQYVETELPQLFPQLDIKLQLHKFKLFNKEKGYNPTDIKTKFISWCELAEEYRLKHNNGDKGNSGDMDKYVKGKYGHVVKR